MLGDSKSWFLEVNNMRIEHVAMYVNDLEKEKAFFETYFDAKAGDKVGKTSFDIAKEVEEYIKSK